MRSIKEKVSSITSNKVEQSKANDECLHSTWMKEGKLETNLFIDIEDSFLSTSSSRIAEPCTYKIDIELYIIWKPINWLHRKRMGFLGTLCRRLFSKCQTSHNSTLPFPLPSLPSLQQINIFCGGLKFIEAAEELFFKK